MALFVTFCQKGYKLQRQKAICHARKNPSFAPGASEILPGVSDQYNKKHGNTIEF